MRYWNGMMGVIVGGGIGSVMIECVKSQICMAPSSTLLRRKAGKGRCMGAHEYLRAKLVKPSEITSEHNADMRVLV